MADTPSTIARIKELHDWETISKDPKFGPFIKNVYPLTGNIGTRRVKRKTLGEGSYGRVNLEECEKGEVATKYFTSNETICENTAEIAALYYLRELPNVAQMIRIESRPVLKDLSATDLERTSKNMQFPAVILGKAIGSLSNDDLYKSWHDIYNIIIQVLRGYYILHSNSIVHRDVKPANMLMTCTGEVWVSDFGMARYLDQTILPIQDAYTGTLYYSSPEVLMKSIMKDYSVIDWYKSDAWAIGVSLYEILVEKYYLFNGNTSTEILHDIFRVKGTPTIEDGSLYDVFTEYKLKTGFDKTFKKDDLFLQVRAYKRAKFRPEPDDADQFERTIDVISNLVVYDPNKRLTMKDALQRISTTSYIPELPPHKVIIEQYANVLPLPPDINTRMLDILFDWLPHVLYRYMPSSQSHHIILDRMGIYTISFLKKYNAHSYTIRQKLQLIGVVALFLSICFFDTSRYSSMDIDDIIYITDRIYTYEQVMECIKMYMKSGIDFYGRTFMDEVLLSLPGRRREQIEKIGLLNYACFHKSLFQTNLESLTKLKEVLLDYVSDPSKLDVSLRLTKNFKIGLNKNEGMNPKIKDFIKSVKAKVGGKRISQTKKHKKYRVQKLKRNTRRNFRNGFGR